VVVLACGSAGSCGGSAEKTGDVTRKLPAANQSAHQSIVGLLSSRQAQPLNTVHNINRKMAGK